MKVIIINHPEPSVLTTGKKKKKKHTHTHTHTHNFVFHGRPFSLAWFGLKCQECFIPLNIEICWMNKWIIEEQNESIINWANDMLAQCLRNISKPFSEKQAKTSLIQNTSKYLNY